MPKQRHSFKTANDIKNKEVFLASKAYYYSQNSLGHLCLYFHIHLWVILLGDGRLKSTTAKIDFFIGKDSSIV